MADTFGLKIGLEGEKDFKKALAEINSTFKVLGSEMKLVESQFDKNDRSVESLTARNGVLEKSIEAQKQKIETLRAALENAATSFGENDKRTQAWQIKLNEAEAALNNMERELKDNNAALDDAAHEFDDAGDQADDFGEEVDDAGEEADDAGNKFEKLGSICKAAGAAIGAAFAAVSAAAVAAGKALVDMSKEGAAYADTVLTESTVTGIATDKLQEYMYAAELVDVSTDTLTKSMAKQIKSMKSAADGSKTMVAAYDQLGVSVTDANGNLRDSDTVYWEIIDALGKVENETERDALGMQLLGKSAQELNPLIEAGAERMNELGAQAREAGYVIDDDMLNAYGALDDQLQYLNVGATAAKNALGTVLLPVLTDLAGEGVELLGEFTNGILDANGDISKMGTVIQDVLPKAFNTILSYLPMIIELAGSLITAFADALCSPETLNAILSAAGTVIESLVSGFLNNLPHLVESALAIVLSLCEFILSPENIEELINAALQVVVTLASGICQALPELIPSVVQAVLTVVKTLLAPENLGMLLDTVFSIIQSCAEGILDALPLIISALPEIIMGVVEFLTAPGNIQKILQAALQLLGAILKAIPEIVISLAKAAPQLVETIGTALKNGLSSIKEIGKNLVKGLWDGIQSLASWLWNKVSGWISSIWDGICDFFGIHSPSKEMAWVGEMLVRGLAGSIEDNGDQAVAAAEAMSEDIDDVMQGLAKDMQTALPTDFSVKGNIGSAIKDAATGTVQSGMSLILNITNFNNYSSEDIQQLTNEIMVTAGEFARRKGVVFA